VREIARRIFALELWIVALGVAPVLIFDSWLPRWAVGLALAAIPLLWLARWLGRGSLTRPTPVDVPIFVLLLMVPVGVWAAADRSLARPEVTRILLGVALFYAVVNGLDSPGRLSLVFVLFLPATALLALVVLLSPLVPYDKIPLIRLPSIYEWLPDVVRPFWNPDGFSKNIAGGILAMVAPVAAAASLWHRRLVPKLAWAVAFLAAALALILTQSRGAIVALFAALLVMAITRTRWFLIAIPLLGAGGLVAVQSLGGSWLGHLLLSDTAAQGVGTLEGRIDIWTRALTMIRDYPVTGIGLGMFDQVRDLLYPISLTGPTTRVFHPHNIYLATAVDAGLPGLLAFLSLLVLLLVMAVQSVRLARGDALRPLAFGLLGALVATVAHGLFDSITSFIKASSIAWAFFGLATALWLCLRDQIKAEPRPGPAGGEQEGGTGQAAIEAVGSIGRAADS
jgi:O-antigen ligase